MSWMRKAVVVVFIIKSREENKARTGEKEEKRMLMSLHFVYTESRFAREVKSFELSCLMCLQIQLELS